MNDVMHRKRARRILGDSKKSVELSTRHRYEKGRLSGLICALRAPHEMEGRRKSHHRKIVHLSPYDETFNPKLIKRFRT